MDQLRKIRMDTSVMLDRNISVLILVESKIHIDSLLVNTLLLIII